MRCPVRRPVLFPDLLMPPSLAFQDSPVLLLLLRPLPLLAVRLPAPFQGCNATFANRLRAMAHV